MVQAPALSEDQTSSGVTSGWRKTSTAASSQLQLNQDFVSCVTNMLPYLKQHSQSEKRFLASEELCEVSIHFLSWNSDPPAAASKYSFHLNTQI